MRLFAFRSLVAVMLAVAAGIVSSAGYASAASASPTPTHAGSRTLADPATGSATQTFALQSAQYPSLCIGSEGAKSGAVFSEGCNFQHPPADQRWWMVVPNCGGIDCFNYFENKNGVCLGVAGGSVEAGVQLWAVNNCTLSHTELWSNYDGAYYSGNPQIIWNTHSPGTTELNVGIVNDAGTTDAPIVLTTSTGRGEQWLMTNN